MAQALPTCVVIIVLQLFILILAVWLCFMLTQLITSHAKQNKLLALHLFWISTIEGKKPNDYHKGKSLDWDKSDVVPLPTPSVEHNERAG